MCLWLVQYLCCARRIFHREWRHGAHRHSVPHPYQRVCPHSNDLLLVPRYSTLKDGAEAASASANRDTHSRVPQLDQVAEGGRGYLKGCGEGEGRREGVAKKRGIGREVRERESREEEQGCKDV